ncbi:hypothetical protein [Dactylosporangium fulvum]|uniref:Glycosyltransferase RgtA/B/C/D-like domain-containing protein n=1 Tax=Dactylosporangium fulvum TaxID=53359 RepID=A0ABY5VZI9_9ACTN|nr:hypothetical protein [Dactylosporangium fulvum]UWP83132.1 hypothetical protein Dfulv_02145 [Dactylosporangium fulvum]
MTDVSFYTTELLQYAILELMFGLRVDVQHVASALTYTLLVLLVAAVARGRAVGIEALVRTGVAVAVILVPASGYGYQILLASPDHTGTAVPLLVTWLVLDRATTGGTRTAGWRLALGLMALLAWAQIGDPLALFVGVVPLVVVSGWRMWRDGKGERSGNAFLLGAALISALVAHTVQVAVWRAGGFSTHPATAEFVSHERLPFNAHLLRDGLAIDFGVYLPDAAGEVDLGLRLLNLLGVGSAAVAVVVGGVRFLRRRTAVDGDRVADVLTVAIVTNLAAFVLSTIPYDLASARQIAVVLPFAAALVGRTLGPALLTFGRGTPTRPPTSRPVAALCVVLSLFAAGLVVRVAAARPVPHEAARAGDWLMAQGESYGLGDYWAANITTVHTARRVRVAPVVAGTSRIFAYRWESHAEWYDPAQHDARFIIVDLAFNSTAAAETHFGAPAERRDFGRFAVLRYEHNLLVGLPAYCVPDVAANLADCPDLKPRLPHPRG